MIIHQERPQKEINYCSCLWQEFTTMTEKELENYKQILKQIRVKEDVKRKSESRVSYE